VIASAIPAHRALLGDDYPALFEAGDDGGLAQLLARAQTDAEWLAQLKQFVSRRQSLFTSEREAQQLVSLIQHVITAF